LHLPNRLVQLEAVRGMLSEPEAMLRRAFAPSLTGCIVITSRSERAQIQSANYGVIRGWLKCGFEGSDPQSQAWVCRLTKTGRKHFKKGRDEK